MKISDRDKKIILILVLACIIALPIVFVIKPCKEKTDALNGEIASLTERFNYLLGLKEQEGFFNDEIARLTKEREDVIASYAEGIREENTIMWLDNFEQNIPLLMKSETYMDINETVITQDSVDEEGNVHEGLMALDTKVAVGFLGTYGQIMEFLKNIENNDTKMNITGLDISYDKNTHILTGMVTIGQYAIAGDGRELPPAVIPKKEYGQNDTLFSYEEYRINPQDLLGYMEEDENAIEETEESEEE